MKNSCHVHYLHFIGKGIEAKVTEIAGTGIQFLSLPPLFFFFLTVLHSPGGENIR